MSYYSDYKKVNRTDRLTSEVQKMLMDKLDLAKSQADSSTAFKLYNYFQNASEKEMLEMAACQVEAMAKTVENLQNEYDVTVAKIKLINDTVVAIHESTEKYGKITDEQAKNAVAAYAALLTMNDNIKDASGDAKIRGASFVIYALLGGEARSYTYLAPEVEDQGQSKRERYIRKV